MSAICGIFDRDQPVHLNEPQSVMKGFDKYKFDQSRVFMEGHIFLGCNLNRVVPESVNEVLPYKDPSGFFVITADAIIDNREELLSLLSMPGLNADIPDSLLILEAYKKWGTSCTDKLVGDYAFAIWDERKEELFCVRDHVGKRTLYYYNDKNMFAFSTLINPLFQIKSINKKLNDTYIADFLACISVCNENDANITIYENIYQLPPAHAMIVSRSGIKQWRYWEIKKSKECKLDTDEEYEEAFREVYSEAVQCRLRSSKKIGIMLSGGLDSGSTACLAAKRLKKENKKLFSFTQVPMKGYKEWLPDSLLADEREYVEELCRFAGNIEPAYIDSEGKSPLMNMDSKTEILEQPYKIIENSYWIDEIFRIAHDMNIGVILSGQSGNATISWGNFQAYTRYLLKSGRVKTYRQEIHAFSKLKNISFGRLYLSTLFNLMPGRVKEITYRLRGGKDYSKVITPINPEFFRKMNGKKRFKRYDIKNINIGCQDSLAERVKMLNEATFSHIGAIETKTAIAFGVEMRDPTRDKRLIEFCINLPENQWVRNGQERRLIRCAMKGQMPDKVRLNSTVRGKQAADWVQRIMPDWGKACEEIATIGSSELERKYLDIPRIKDLLNKNRELKYDDDGFSGVRLLLRALIFTRFLRSLDLQENRLPE